MVCVRVPIQGIPLNIRQWFSQRREGEQLKMQMVFEYANTLKSSINCQKPITVISEIPGVVTSMLSNSISSNIRQWYNQSRGREHLFVNRKSLG